MELLIKFLLSVTGLTLILTKSVLFKPTREYVSSKYLLIKLKHPCGIVWFIDSILNCQMCCGLWVSIPIYCAFYGFDWYVILYMFMGSCVSHFSSELIDAIKRK